MGKIQVIKGMILFCSQIFFSCGESYGQHIFQQLQQIFYCNFNRWKSSPRLLSYTWIEPHAHRDLATFNSSHFFYSHHSTAINLVKSDNFSLETKAELADMHLVVMSTFLLESQSAIPTGVWSGLVQIDVDLRVSQVFVAARAKHDSLGALDDRLLGNQINGPVLVDNLCGVSEAHISVILLVVRLKRCKQKCYSIKLQQQRIDLAYLACVRDFVLLLRCTHGTSSLCCYQSSISPVCQLRETREFSNTRHFHEEIFFSGDASVMNWNKCDRAKLRQV